MPLFRCSKCDSVENTALGEYWWRKHEGSPVLCSECASGDWHGQFEKQPFTNGKWIEGEDGFVYQPHELAKGGSLAHVTRPKREP